MMEITQIKDAKLTKEIYRISGKVKDYNTKQKKNGQDYIEGIIEDKTGTLKFTIFDKNIISSFLNKLKEKVVVENKKIKNLISLKGYYQKEWNNFVVNELLCVSPEEYKEYIEIPEKDLSKILDFFKELKWENQYFNFLYKNIVLENLDQLKILPYTIYKSFNYKGGLLERTYYFYDFILNNYKSLTEFSNNLNKELLLLSGILKYLPSKYLSINVDDNDEYIINDMGKLLSNEYLTNNTISTISSDYFDKLEKEINKLKSKKENLLKEESLKISELQEKLNKLKLKKEKYVKYYKILENFSKQKNEEKEITGGVLEEELLSILEDNIIKEKFDLGDFIYDNFDSENQKIILKTKKSKKEISLDKLVGFIIIEGKNLNEIISNIETKIDEITNNSKEIKLELDNLIKKELENYKNNKKLLLKLLHIIETSNYFFKENENHFPSFKEAYLFANINFSFTNTTFFIQEYKKLTENIKEEDTIFSNKYGKYLYL